jgi:hypothetical protein
LALQVPAAPLAGFVEIAAHFGVQVAVLPVAVPPFVGQLNFPPAVSLCVAEVHVCWQEPPAAILALQLPTAPLLGAVLAAEGRAHLLG